MAEVLFAVLFYLFLLVGSFSLGYLVLRFVYPEIRTFDSRNKAITVAVVGAAISLSTIALDYSISGPRVLSLDSFSMPLMFIVTLFYFLILRVYFLYGSASREFITVGIPIASTVPLAAPVAPLKQKPEKPGGVVIEAKKAQETAPDISRKIAEIKKRIEEKMEKEKTSEVKKLREEKRQLELKLEGETAKLQAEKAAESKRVEEEKRSFEAKLDASQKAQVEQAKMQLELKKLVDEKKKLQEEFGKELKRREEELRQVTIGRKKAEEEEKQAEQKRLEAERKRLEEEKKKLQRQFEEDLKRREAELTKKLEVEKKAAVEAEKKKVELAKKLGEELRLQEERQVEARKARLQFSIGESQTYVEKIKQRLDVFKKTESKKTGKAAEISSAPVIVQAVKGEEKIAQLKKESIVEPVEVKLEVKSISPVALPVQPSETEKKVQEVRKRIEERKAAESTQLQVPLAPAKIEKRPSGFFDSIFGGKKEQKPVVPKAPEMATWRTAKQEEAKRLGERKKAAEEKKKEEAELEQLLKTVTKEAEQSAVEEGPVHRRYLLKGQVKVVASKEVAQKEEFGYMVQDIYSQLHAAQRETSVADVLKVDTPKAQVSAKGAKEKPASGKEEKGGEKTSTAQASQWQKSPVMAAVQAAKPEAGVSVSDILGTDLFGPSKSTAPSGAGTPAGDLFASEAAPMPGGGDIFSQLSAAASGTPVPQAQLTSPSSVAAKSDVSFVQIQAEKGVGCPTCHAKTSKIIFCPYCSTGMCANCSPSIKPLGPGQFTYVCPKCGEEVSVKKKAG